jgi:poly(beta-D-mannuronate) lyase
MIKLFLLLGIALFSFRIHACEPAPPPVMELNVNSYYTDSKHSVIDPVLKAKHDEAVKPLEDFIKKAAHDVDHGQESCAVAWLYTWAQGKSLLGKMTTEQAFYERKWMLAGFALVFSKAEAFADAQQKEIILHWLKTLTDQTIEHSDAHHGPRNNHYYWEGVAVGAVGALSGEEKYQSWAKGVYQYAMNQIQNDGSLPLELARGQRALHYHAFSAAPLVLLASIYQLKTDRLSLLVGFIFRNLLDPTQITGMVGAPQVSVPDNHLAWIEIYLRLKASSEMEQYISSKRPLGNSKLGGNLSIRNPIEGANPMNKGLFGCRH